MKTTIEIPDALAARARALATERGTTLRALVVAGLRSEVERVSAPPSVDFAFPTVGGRGLSVELDPAEVVALSYEPLARSTPAPAIESAAAETRARAS